MSNTSPYNGPPEPTATTGDPPYTPTHQQKHMITRVVDGKSVTMWHYILNIMNGTNNFLSIKRLLDIISTNDTSVFITHQKSGRKLTQDLLKKANNILDICTSVTGFNSTKPTTFAVAYNLLILTNATYLIHLTTYPVHSTTRG